MLRGSSLRVWVQSFGVGFKDESSTPRGYGLRVWVQGSGFRVQGGRSQRESTQVVGSHISHDFGGIICDRCEPGPHGGTSRHVHFFRGTEQELLVQRHLIHRNLTGINFISHKV